MRILVAERLGVLVVGEQLAVAAEIDDRPQRPLGVVLRHVVLELLAEAGRRRAVARPLVEHPLDVRGERNVGEQLVAEQLLALVDVHVDEALADRRELDVAFGEFGQLQQLQGFAEREEIVDLELQRVGQMRQVGLAVVGRAGDLLEHAGERVGRDQRQREAEAGAGRDGFAAGRLGLGALGHQRVDPVDELAKFGVEAVARLGKGNGDVGRDAPRIRRQHQHAIAHQHRFLDVVGDHQDRFDRNAPFLPEVEQVGAQGFRGQHVERRERLVHQQNLRLHDQRAGEADALAHAAGKLLRIGGFEAVETDDVDRLQRAFARFVGRDALRPEPDFDVVEHRKPGEQREALEHHRDAFGGAVDRPAVDRNGSRGWMRQPGNDAQQRRLAAA